MSVLITVLGDILNFSTIIMVCGLFFKFDIYKGKYQRIRQIVAALVMIGVSVYCDISNNSDFICIVYMPLVIFLIRSLYKEKMNRIIVISVWIVFILSIFYFILALLFDCISNILNVNFEEFKFLFVSVLSLLFVLFTGLYYNKKCNISIKYANIGSLVVFSLVATADTFIVGLMAAFIEEYYMNNIFLVLMFCIVVLGIFFQLAIVIMLFVQKNMYMEEKQRTQKYLNEQKNYYEFLEIRERETKKFRHDITSHMKTLSSLIKDKNFMEADSYLAQISEKVENLGNLITVHNGIADAVINQYYSMAQQKNIDMQVEGRFPNNCGIDAYDLCTIFSNILSNAIESAEKTDDKKILLSCRYTNENIIINVKNTFKDSGQLADGRFKTSKKDANYHGFGLENIRDCVDKNNGMLDIEIEDNQFTIMILLEYEG